MEVLQSNDVALSADEILEQLSTKANRVTVYRILERFEKEGLVHKVIGLEGKSYYASCGEHCDEHDHQDMHAHFQCKKCKTLECVDVEIVRPRISQHHVDEVQVLLSGYCQNCKGEIG